MFLPPNRTVRYGSVRRRVRPAQFSQLASPLARRLGELHRSSLRLSGGVRRYICLGSLKGPGHLCSSLRRLCAEPPYLSQQAVLGWRPRQSLVADVTQEQSIDAIGGLGTASGIPHRWNPCVLSMVTALRIFPSPTCLASVGGGHVGSSWDPLAAYEQYSAGGIYYIILLSAEAVSAPASWCLVSSL